MIPSHTCTYPGLQMTSQMSPSRVPVQFTVPCFTWNLLQDCCCRGQSQSSHGRIQRPGEEWLTISSVIYLCYRVVDYRLFITIISNMMTRIYKQASTHWLLLQVCTNNFYLTTMTTNIFSRRNWNYTLKIYRVIINHEPQDLTMHLPPPPLPPQLISYF